MTYACDDSFVHQMRSWNLLHPVIIFTTRALKYILLSSYTIIIYYLQSYEKALVVNLYWKLKNKHAFFVNTHIKHDIKNKYSFVNNFKNTKLDRAAKKSGKACSTLVTIQNHRKTIIVVYGPGTKYSKSLGHTQAF